MSNWLRKRICSFAYAFAGLGKLVSGETNFILQLIAAAVVVSAGFIFRITTTEWLIIIIAIGMVLAAEAFNTVIEKLADEITREKKPAIKTIKDASAAAVLITSFAAAAAAVVIFWKYLF